MSNKNTVQPAFNSDQNIWNLPVNQNTQNFDDALGTVQTFALTSVSGTVAVSGTSFAGAYPANTASYIPLIFSCSGIPTGAVTLQIPASVGGIWIVNNQCTGTFAAVTVASGGAGISVVVPGGTSANVYSDGTNIGLTSTRLSASTSVNDSRTINGDMRIDQRNNGASGTAINVYTVDRWYYAAAQSSKGTWGQNLSGPSLPVGFPYCLGFISSSSYSVAGSDFFAFQQPIEADEVSDFAWGTANAQPVTLSFYVVSSISGTFGGSIRNSGLTRSYPFSYSVNGGWQKVTITVPGDTSGTWVMSGNGVGAIVSFSLGAGSTFSGSNNVWASGNFVSPTGATSVVGTASAYFYITGVKLEIGSVATQFAQESLAKRLADCQRYCPVISGVGTVAINNACSGVTNISSGGAVIYPFKVTPRVPPTGIVVKNVGSFVATEVNASAVATSIVFDNSSFDCAGLTVNTASSSFAINNPLFLQITNANALIVFTGCEL